MALQNRVKRYRMNLLGARAPAGNGGGIYKCYFFDEKTVYMFGTSRQIICSCQDSTLLPLPRIDETGRAVPRPDIGKIRKQYFIYW